MAYTTLLAQIKSAVEGVTGIGVVRDYLRWWSDKKDFLDLFRTTIGGQAQIRGWTITRDGIPFNERYAQGGKHRVTHMFVIRGVLGLQDGTATEKTFQALVDSVVDALDDAVTLGGNVRSAGPATAAAITHRGFGEVLCHYCEIQFPVTEHVDRTYDA